jgi:hypothetical protein
VDVVRDAGIERSVDAAEHVDEVDRHATHL